MLLKIGAGYCQHLGFKARDELVLGIMEEAALDLWDFVSLSNNFRKGDSYTEEGREKALKLYNLMQADPIRFYLPFLDYYNDVEKKLSFPFIISEKTFLEELHLLQ